MGMFLKIALLALVITLVIWTPSAIVLYRFAKKNIEKYDYDTTKEGWIKYETDEDWENWQETQKKALEGKEETVPKDTPETESTSLQENTSAEENPENLKK